MPSLIVGRVIGLFALIFLHCTTALALELQLAGPTDNIPLGSDGRNQAFEIVLTMSNPASIAHGTSGFKELLAYLNEDDITDAFLSTVTLETDHSHPVAVAAMRKTFPAGQLDEGVHFLNVGVMNQSSRLSTANLVLRVGNPNIVSPVPGNASQLRQLVDNPGNRYIHVPEGYYYLHFTSNYDNTIIVLKSGQTIFGDGPGKTILDGANIAGSGLSCILVRGTGAAIHGLQVQNVPQASGIQVDGNYSVLAGHVASMNNYGSGVAGYNNGAKATVINGRFSGNGFDGVTVGDTGRAFVAMSFADSNGLDGFGAERNGYLSLDFSESTRNKGVGIGLFTGSTGYLSRNYAASNGISGIILDPGTRATSVSRNWVSGHVQAGIGLLGPNTTVDRMDWNYATDNGNGVIVNQGAAAVATGLISNANRGAGLLALNGGQVRCEKCTLSSNRKHGAGADHQGTWIDIRESLIERNSEYGLLVQQRNGARYNVDQSTIFRNNSPANMGIF